MFKTFLENIRGTGEACSNIHLLGVSSRNSLVLSQASVEPTCYYFQNRVLSCRVELGNKAVP